MSRIHDQLAASLAAHTDAHLIAAAPDMYEALREIDKSWSVDFSGPDSPLAQQTFTSDTIARWKAMRVAIAKAEGRAQ